jgi:hypothetical protein
MDESRRFKRFGIDVPVQIELIQSRRKRKVIETYVSNLSAVGAFLHELKFLPVGQRLKADIYFLFDGPNPFCKEGYELIMMTVNGSVVRSGPNGTGIIFDDDYRLSSRRIVKDHVMMKDVDESHAADGCFEIISNNIGKKGRNDFKTAVDENYRKVEDFLMQVGCLTEGEK